jgi:hypothetical protein
MLFTLQTKSEVDKFIQDARPSATWRNLGDRESPAANVEVSPDPINPLVERLVNSMESLIQLKLELEHLKGKGHRRMPSSVFEAAEKYFGVPQGRARNLSTTGRRQLAQNLKLILRGKRGVPTVVVQDKGIGVHPDDMPDTILSLANSSKGKKPYLIGAYGHGGSSIYEWCEYTVIICRKEPHLLNDRQDLVGWTIVKKSRESGARINDYQYLVDASRRIPRFDPKLLGTRDFTHGVFVCHIDMRDTGAFGTQPTGLAPFQTLDYRLFDPVLPYLLVEERPEFIGGASHQGLKGYKGGWDRALAGIRGRLDGLYSNPEKDRRVEFWNKGYTVQLGGGRTVCINYWVIEDLDVDPITNIRKNDHKGKAQYLKDGGRLYQRPCAVTFGGQVHTSLTEKVFRERSLRRVGESTIIHIETDGMGDIFPGFFGSNRGEPKEQSEKQLEQWIAEAIEVHLRELRAIEYHRFEAFLQRSKAQQDIEVRTLLDPMIQEFLKKEMADLKETVARRKLPYFKPKQVPTYLTFANPNKVVQLTRGDSVNVVALTNARDDVMPKAKFELSLSNPSILTASLTSHYAGRWVIRVSAYSNVAVNSTCELNATLRCQGAWICKTPKPLRIKIVIPSPPPLYSGSDPPSRFRIRTQGGEIRLQEGKRRVIWIDTDCVDDLLTRSVDAASFEVVSLPHPLIYRGLNLPLRGQIGLVVSTPTGIAPLEPGYLEVRMKLADGSWLSDKAPVKILPQSSRGGTITIEAYLKLPNYEVIYVTEQPSKNGDKSWRDMQDPFGQEWDKEDVAGYTIAPDVQGNDKLWIFINRDFADLVAEQRDWGRHGESRMKRMTNLYDAQVAFQCYQASIGRGDRPRPEGDSSDSSMGYHFVHREYLEYRGEMVRVGKTILWARKQFGAVLPDDEDLT